MLRQSRTLARPAAPLATGVMKISSVDKTIKKTVRHRNGLWWIETLFSAIFAAIILQSQKSLAKIGPVDCQITGLTWIVKEINKQEKEAEHIARRACLQ